MRRIRSAWVTAAAFAVGILPLTAPPARDLSPSAAIAAAAETTDGSISRAQLQAKADTLEKESHRLISASRASEALSIATERVAVNRQLYPPEEFPKGHENLVRALLDLGLVARMRRDFDQATCATQEALRMATAISSDLHLPTVSRLVADCLRGCGDLESRKGDSSRAAQFYWEAVDILRRVNEEERSRQTQTDLVVVLVSLGAASSAGGQPDAAERCFVEVEAIWKAILHQTSLEQLTGDELRNYVFFLYESANHYRRIGNQILALQRSESVVNAARNGLKKVDGIGEAEFVTFLFKLSSDYLIAGRRIQAKRCLLELKSRLEEGESLKGTRLASSLLASCCLQLADIYATEGELIASQQSVDRAMAIAAQAYPRSEFPHGTRTLAGLMNRGSAALVRLGELERARHFAEDSLKMTQRFCEQTQLAEDRQTLAAAFFQLAEVVEFQRDYRLAADYTLQTVEIHRSLHPADRFPNGHPELSLALQNAGIRLLFAGDVDQAVEHTQAAVEMWRSRNPAEMSPDDRGRFADALQILATIHRRRGRFDEAIKSLDEAGGIFEQLDRGDPIVEAQRASLMLRRALVLTAARQYGPAKLLAEESMTLWRGIFPPDRFPEGHMSLVTASVDSSLVSHAASDCPRAASILVGAATTGNGLLVSWLAGLSETESLDLIARESLLQSLLLSAARRSGLDAETLYDIIWRQRGIVHRTTSYRQMMLRRAKSPTAQQLLEEHRQVTRDLTRLLLQPDAASRDQELLEATRHKESLERSLSWTLREAGVEELQLTQSSADLVKALPPESAFIDLVRYVDIPTGDEAPGDVLEAGVPRYVGFAVQRDRPVRMIDFGTAAEIDAATVGFRRTMTEATGDSPAGQSLCRLVWGPIGAVLAPATRTVYLSPDGALTGLPWGCLPGSPDGTPLLIDYAFAVVPSGQFLLEQLARVPPSAPTPSDLLLVGDVAFDDGSDDGPSGALQFATRSAVGVPRSQVWRPLPGTKAEVEGIASVARPFAKVILSGSEATAGRVASELANARWAHLATHGFFSDAAYQSRMAFADASQFERLVYGTGLNRVSAAARNPLLLSGLVLAGANSNGRSADEPRDPTTPSILTAEAISFLPLDNLELAVLSACDTGLGDVAGGEGVLGLQRAFHAAGARNAIASLWQVDDEATAVLMRVFYEKMLLEKRSPLQALRDAQLTIYRSPDLLRPSRDDRGIDFAKTSRLKPPENSGQAPSATTHPGFWGAFVLSGVGQ